MHVTKSPGLPPWFFHTANDQNWSHGEARPGNEAKTMAIASIYMYLRRFAKVGIQKFNSDSDLVYIIMAPLTGYCSNIKTSETNFFTSLLTPCWVPMKAFSYNFGPWVSLEI